MSSTTVNVYIRAAGLGVLTGLRSLGPLALLSHDAPRHGKALAGTPLQRLADPRVRTGLALAAAGEVVADKLPFVPNRTNPGPLVGRMVLGGLVGAIVLIEQDEPPVLGAALGAVGALLGSYGGYLARRQATHALHVPDLLAALVEDALVVGVGSRIAGL